MKHEIACIIVVVCWSLIFTVVLSTCFRITEGYWPWRKP